MGAVPNQHARIRAEIRTREKEQPTILIVGKVPAAEGETKKLRVSHADPIYSPPSKRQDKKRV